jgi:hypothetical protein
MYYLTYKRHLCKVLKLVMLQTVGNTYGNFSLATMFPRREFTKEDYKKNLLDLELAPSASVVLLPVCICAYKINIFSALTVIFVCSTLGHFL